VPSEVRSYRSLLETVRAAWGAESLRGRFARGALWSLVGAVISQGTNLIASIITARLLGREQFGQYGMVQSTVGMLASFAGLGLGVTATKYVAELRNRDPERAGRIIALSSLVAVCSGGLLALFLVFLAPALAASTLNAPALATELRIASVLLLLNAINGVQTGALTGFEAFRAIARINLVRGLAAFPLTVTLVLLWRLPGAVWALAASAAIACWLSQRALQQCCAAAGIRTKLSSSWVERRVLWTFSTPAFLSGAMVAPVTWIANTMLVNQPGGYREMAIFAAASQWRNAVIFLPSLLLQPLLPLLSNLSGERPQAFSRLLWGSVALVFAVSSCLSLPIILYRLPVMSAYGRDFSSGGPVLAILLVSAILSVSVAPVGQAIAAQSAMWSGFALNSLWAVVMLASAWLMVRPLGAEGLAWAWLLSYVAHAVSVSIYARYRLRRSHSDPAVNLALPSLLH
jgi:O-antigen/teichoic acid export membrane protein